MFYYLDLNVDKIDNLSITDLCQICELITSQIMSYFKEVLLPMSRTDQSHVDRIKIRLLWYMDLIKRAHGHNDDKNEVSVYDVSCIVIAAGQSHHRYSEREWNPMLFHEIGPIALSRLLQLLYKHTMANLEIKIQDVREVPHLHKLDHCEVDIESMLVNFNRIATQLHSNQVYSIDNDTSIVHAKFGVKLTPGIHES
jgi:hypothetical protein